jgi:SOS-response transcriptional repressor LexA
LPYKNVEISEKQLETYLSIIRHVEEHGYQPTQQEMADALGVTRRAIFDRLRQFADKGFIFLPEGNIDRNIGLPHLRFEAQLAHPEEENNRHDEEVPSSLGKRTRSSTASRTQRP